MLMTAGTDSTRLRLMLGEIRAIQNEYNRKVDTQVDKIIQELKDIEDRERLAAAPKPVTRESVIKAAKAFTHSQTTYSTFDVDFHVNRDKRIVTCLIKRMGKIVGKGLARCTERDVFNVHIGKAIAIARALDKKVPAMFLQPPTPTELGTGTVVHVEANGKRYVIINRHPDFDHRGHGKAYTVRTQLPGSQGWLGEKQFRVVEDTDVEYGVRSWQSR